MSDDKSDKSMFNAGVQQVIEVRTLQNVLNRARIDLISMNQNPNFPFVPNYQLCLEILNSLFNEVKPKCNAPNEKEVIQNIKNVAEQFIVKHPIIKNIRINDKLTPVVDYPNLNIFKKILDDYENLVREALEKHEMNSPSKADLGKSIIQM